MFIVSLPSKPAVRRCLQRKYSLRKIELPCLLLFFVIPRAQCLVLSIEVIGRLRPMGNAAGRRLFEENILLKGDFRR
jgi:hypothetical protein